MASRATDRHAENISKAVKLFKQRPTLLPASRDALWRYGNSILARQNGRYLDNLIRVDRAIGRGLDNDT